MGSCHSLFSPFYHANFAVTSVWTLILTLSKGVNEARVPASSNKKVNHESGAKPVMNIVTLLQEMQLTAESLSVFAFLERNTQPILGIVRVDLLHSRIHT